jgi:hypothetical protein
MKRGKLAQLNLSFGMIFSIILIIAFVALAIYITITFLNMQNDIKIAKFVSDFQSDVDKMWNAEKGSREVEYYLPTKIREVCLVDETKNLVFDEKSKVPAKNIQNVDVKGSLDSEDEICFSNLKGKVKMIIKKSFGEELVKIEK